ncbi:LysR family transcriptional regulator [Clostridium sp. chh4-2]|uniref:LysR family transcriptional regulator n=1 Tax=Clostridium sp. chh4-2 TaxID=2067550 RepID=UPI000CCFB0D7|nr:LysR family transcriptional regulator [Clostridium sp. chh4-2]PNV61919.1 LysR family transcriptional regulator [Clostridium sp. chh4-2]
MINFLNLEYFLTAAEELNFTKAAKRLYISQQSLSNHISNLEKEFDVILFNRTTPLTLTYAGQALKARARQFLDLRDETYKEIADIKDFSTGRISIGVSHTRGRKILPEILPLYKERFPNIELHLVEGNSSELDSDLLHGKVDLIIGMLPFKVDNIETVPLCDEEVLLAVSDSVLEKAFPGKVEETKMLLEHSNDLSILDGCPFLLLNKGNRVRTIADEIFEDSQITPRIILETENIETVMALAGKGMGITFYPKMFIASRGALDTVLRERGPLNFYSLNYPKAHGVLAIGYHKGHYLSQATKEFIRIAKETI